VDWVESRSLLELSPNI